MAWTKAHIPLVGALARAWETFLALRPTFALAAVWLTTSGHTMNFREMDAARGWVTAEGYSLHSIYLGTIALTLLAAPNLVSRFGSYGLVLGGLGLLTTGAAINGFLLHAPAGILVLGRVLAGIGSGFVIREAPRIHAPDWRPKVAWAGILLPPAGPLVIAAAVHAAGVTSWQGGFFFEGALAVFALAVVLSIANPIDPEPETPRSLAYLPALALSAGCVWYVMHWGQLHGWLEAPDIVAAICVLIVALSVTAWIAWLGIDMAALRENVPRLLLVVYGGFVQYFNVSDMGVYGGLLVNFSPWMRAWLVISLSVGAATGLALGRLYWGGRTPGYGGATLGLLVLATGMGISHNTTLNWPFWEVLSPVEFHWFSAPQHWQLAPQRFLMGFGIALVLLSMTTRSSRNPAREAKVRPYLEVLQFGGGALSVGALVTVLLIAHATHYSYTSDQGFIQADEQRDRQERLTEALTQSGSRSAERQARALLFQSVNYQADNLVFASIYGAFFVSSLLLAACCFVGWMVEIGHSYHAWKWPARSLDDESVRARA